MKRFNGICLITPDVRRLCDFYCAVLQGQSVGDDTAASVSTEGAELTFCPEQGVEQLAPGSMKEAGRGCCALEFQVEDVAGE